MLERVDVQDLKQGDKVVLLKWGAFEILSKTEDSMELKFLPEDKDFKNPPKITWLANKPENLVEIDYVEFGDLLNVKKIEEGMQFEEIVN